MLHTFGSERVMRVHLPASAAFAIPPDTSTELFVLEGTLRAAAMVAARWTWLRTPDSIGRLEGVTDCSCWIKLRSTVR